MIRAFIPGVRQARNGEGFGTGRSVVFRVGFGGGGTNSSGGGLGGGSPPYWAIAIYVVTE